VKQESIIERIRGVTFNVSRRGYDRREVEKFLGKLADWLESGGGDQARSETVRKELEKVGERTSKILASAEESAQQIRNEAESEVRSKLKAAEKSAKDAREKADEYAARTRRDSDDYQEKTRAAADQYANATRGKAEQQAAATIQSGEEKAARIVVEGEQRRDDIETVIADLVRRRDAVLADLGDLGSQLRGTITQFAPGEADRFVRPPVSDPVERGEEAPKARQPRNAEGEGEGEGRKEKRRAAAG
jgi:DivIVA domain-containing protein